MSKICYIIGAGKGFLSFERKEGDLVIAADGGYRHLCALGVRPDLLLGDFDSLGDDALPSEDIEILRFPVRKDETDSALAFRYAYERGYREFVLLGATGGRADHTFAAYQLLLHARRLGARIVLVGEGELTECLISEERSFDGVAGATLSVFAFGADACGVDIEGASYELSDGTLTVDNPLGVSNAFLGAPVRISVREGALLVMRERAK